MFVLQGELSVIVVSKNPIILACILRIVLDDGEPPPPDCSGDGANYCPTPIPAETPVGEVPEQFITTEVVNLSLDMGNQDLAATAVGDDMIAVAWITDGDIYDNISDPAQLAAQGYTIGVEDKLGERGVTYAFAPCCGDPPLHLRPVLFGAANDYSRTFSYEAIVNGQIPETITTTAVATSSSHDPALAHVWATHYLYVRWQTYLPLLRAEEVAP